MLINVYLLYFLIFMLGASFASFIAVYVERGNIWGRSICSDCLKQLNFFELVPIFSYLFLKGKCRYCKTEIPEKLFLGELLLGIWFLASYIFFPNIIEIGLSWVLGAVFFLLSLEDLENMEVSSLFVYVLFAVGIINAILRYYFNQDVYQLYVPLLIFSPFWLIYLINRNWIGEADPYVYTGLGLFFGTQFSISVFLYSVWLGAAYGIFYLVFINKKIERNIRIPYLPIIFLSTLFILTTDYHIIKIQDILILYEIL